LVLIDLIITRVSTKVLILLSTKSEFRRNYSLISSKFRCFNFPKISILISMSKLEFRLRFRFRHRNFNSDFDFGIPILTSMSEFRLPKSKARFSNQILTSVAGPHLCFAASAPAPAPSKNFAIMQIADSSVVDPKLFFTGSGSDFSMSFKSRIRILLLKNSGVGSHLFPDET
jgi:hypothetical protein